MTDETNTLKPRTKGSWKEAARNLVFIVISIAVAYFITISVGIDTLRETVASTGIWGPFILILLKMTTIVVVPLGGGPIYALAGVVFGFWKGWLLVIVGDILGFSVAFLLSRFFGKSILYFFLPTQYKSAVEQFLIHASETKRFLKARFMFTGFPEIFAYAAGLTSVSFPFFLIVQMGVHAPLTSFAVLFGDLLVSGDTLVFIIASMIALSAAVIGGWWFHRDVTRSA